MERSLQETAALQLHIHPRAASLLFDWRHRTWDNSSVARAPSPHIMNIWNCVSDSHFPEVCYALVCIAQSLHAGTSLAVPAHSPIPGLPPEWFAKPDVRMTRFLCCYCIDWVICLGRRMTTPAGHFGVIQHFSSLFCKTVFLTLFLKLGGKGGWTACDGQHHSWVLLYGL